MSEITVPYKAEGEERIPEGTRISGVVIGEQSNIFETLNLITNADGTVAGSNATSNRSAAETLYPPVNVTVTRALKDTSPHHAACISAKKNCMVGLGFLSDDDLTHKKEDDSEKNASEMASLLTASPYIKSKVDEELDPLTMFGFQQELSDMVEDYLDCGTGYLEVVRTGEQITHVEALPANAVRIIKKGRNIYYEVTTRWNATKYFSRFGLANKEWLFSEEGPYASSSMARDDVSEIVQIAEPTNRCKYYGYPPWLSASIYIDMLKKANQYKSDFYHNRGVMDFVFAVTGARVDEPQWDAINAKISGTSGMGNNFKSMAVNVAKEGAKVEVLRLASEGKTEDQFAGDNEVFAQNIVTAHGMPPLLANILIPGKMGGVNEFMNSLTSFQLLRVGPAQQTVQKALASSLGNPAENGVLTLKETDFRLRTITSQMNLKGLDTMSRMREEATDTDRDLNDGLKD